MDTDGLPPDLRTLYTGLVPYEFFDAIHNRAGCGNSTRPLGTPRCNASTNECTTSPTISPRCSNTWETLRTRAKRTANPKTIFLATTTSDLEPQRDQLRRELIELGHTVVPKQPLPLVARELVAAVHSCLEQADVAIHFVGEHFGLVPEATDLSMVALQNQVAARFCEHKPLQRLIWIPKGLQPRMSARVHSSVNSSPIPAPSRGPS